MKVVDSSIGQPYSALQPIGTSPDSCMSLQLFHFIPDFRGPPQCWQDRLSATQHSLLVYTGAQLPFHCAISEHLVTPSCAPPNLSSEHTTTSFHIYLFPGPDMSLSLENPRANT